MTKKQTEKVEARTTLLKNYIKPDTKLGIVITNTSRSGMCRRMRVLVNDFHDITRLIGMLCDIPVNDKGLQIGGCGMDMTFWLADNITWHLWENDKPKELTGNGGTCLEWSAIY